MVGTSCQPGVHNNLLVVHRSNLLDRTRRNQTICTFHILWTMLSLLVVQSINLYLDLIILSCQMPSSVRCNRNRK